MTYEQWEILESILKQENDKLYTGFITDSPWMPGYCGLSNLDFYCRPDVWFESYRKIKKDFPQTLFLPDWWVEYGMCAEPSGFGVKFDLYPDNMPTLHHIIKDTEDLDVINALTAPDPRKNGLMAFALNLEEYYRPRIADLGEFVPFVAARGPLTIASHLMSVTEFLIGVKSDGDVIHKILKVTTQLCKDWLDAQLDAVKTAKGVLVLDDITGFLDDDDYLEFSHPYLKDIFSHFPGMIHFLHNDAVRTNSYRFLEDMGVDLFNPSHKTDISQIKKLVGNKVCILGNVPPMSLARETVQAVTDQTKAVISSYREANGGSLHGLLVSAGGGLPMGAKGENIQALIETVENTQ